MLAERLHMYLEKRRSFCPDGCKTALHEALDIPLCTTGKSHTIDFNKFQINFAIPRVLCILHPSSLYAVKNLKQKPKSFKNKVTEVKSQRDQEYHRCHTLCSTWEFLGFYSFSKASGSHKSEPCPALCRGWEKRPAAKPLQTNWVGRWCLPGPKYVMKIWVNMMTFDDQEEIGVTFE